MMMMFKNSRIQTQKKMLCNAKMLKNGDLDLIIFSDPRWLKIPECSSVLIYSVNSKTYLLRKKSG